MEGRVATIAKVEKPCMIYMGDSSMMDLTIQTREKRSCERMTQENMIE